MALYIKGPDSGGNCCDCSTRTNPCDTCSPSSNCGCKMTAPYGKFIDLYGASFSSYAFARLILDKFADNCYFLWLPLGMNSSLFSSSLTRGVNAVTLLVSGIGDDTNGKVLYQYTSLTMKAGSLSVDWTTSNIFTVDFLATLKSCDGTTVDSSFSTSLNGNFSLNVPSDGEYILEMSSAFGDLDAPNINQTTILTNGNGLIINPAFGKWDDSGNDRYLPSCPKFFIPSFNVGASWYATEADANLGLSTYVDNCIASYSGPNSNSDATVSFSASASTSLISSLHFSPTGLDFQYVSSSISFGAILKSGSTFSTDYIIEFDNNFTPRTGTIYLSIFDFDGTSITTKLQSISFPLGINTITGTITTTDLIPYDGAYQISLSIVKDGILSNALFVNYFYVDIVAYSSDTVSFNPPQALYDVGLTCPARIEC